MSKRAHPALRVAAGLLLAVPFGLIAWKATGPAATPQSPRLQKMEQDLTRLAAREEDNVYKADPANWPSPPL